MVEVMEGHSTSEINTPNHSNVNKFSSLFFSRVVAHMTKKTPKLLPLSFALAVI